MEVERHNRVMIDPSVLFTDAAVGWLEDESLRPFLAVSLSLRQMLANPELSDRFGPFEGFELADRPQQILALLEGIATFSWEEVDVLSAPAVIRDALRESDEAMAEVFADEWVFLVSQSWAILGPATRTLRAFAHAGARVYEVADAQMTAALQAIREQLPPPILHGMKEVARLTDRVPGFWIAAGGMAAGAIVPFVGLPIQVLGLVLAGEAVIAGDP